MSKNTTSNNMIHVELIETDPLEGASPLLAIPFFEDDEDLSELITRADEALAGAISRARAAGDLNGKDGENTTFYVDGSGPDRLVLLGSGPRENYDLERVRRVAARAVRVAESRSLESLSLHLPVLEASSTDTARAAAEGAVLAAWKFLEEKTDGSSFGDGEESDSKPPVTEVGFSFDSNDVELAEGLRTGQVFAEAENFARTLQNRPGNVATPSHLGSEVERMGKESGLKVRVLGPTELLAERMSALLAVSRGSEEEPRLIVMEHNGGDSGDPPLVLIGKGLTFDAGGISIKPASGMEDMKFDMSGGAAVIGAMKAIAELQIPINVVGIVPSSENLLSGKALKPGDIIDTRAGKKVEIINTDAEGRLILCDALDYARSLEPSAIVDCATLTGAVVIGLGSHAMAVLGTDDDLIEELREAGDRVWERCWPFPLWKEYRPQLDSDYADLKNVGGRAAGTITAAWYLREFVGDCPWAHLDIAGSAYGDGKLPYQRKGGHGWPTRMLVEWVRMRAE